VGIIPHTFYFLSWSSFGYSNMEEIKFKDNNEKGGISEWN